MGKSVSEKKVRNYISNDLAFSILSKPPLKSFKRFECVCKSWSLLFENSCFRINFISIPDSYYNDTSVLLFENVHEFVAHDHDHHDHDYYYHDISIHSSSYLLSGDRYENQVKLNFPNPIQEEKIFFDFNTSYYYGCDPVTGTICLSKGKHLVLWNPTTNEYKAIPPSSLEAVPPYRELASQDLHGFGYDHIKDDFKIIRYMQFISMSDQQLERLDVRYEDVSWNEISYEPEWEIYSLRCNSWSKLDINMPHHSETGSSQLLNIDGMSHWWYESENRAHILVSFDLSNETFVSTPIPIEIQSMPIDIQSDIETDFYLGMVQRRLVVLNGSLSAISWYYKSTIFHISILGELGVKESWTKLFVVGPLSYISCLIGEGKNGDIFFQKKDGKVVYFNLSTQKAEEIGFKADPRSYDIAIYKKSLLSIGGINN